MITCLGKCSSFDLLWLSFMNVSVFMCASLPNSFEGVMWDLTALTPDHFLSFYFTPSFKYIFSILTVTTMRHNHVTNGVNLSD